MINWVTVVIFLGLGFPLLLLELRARARFGRWFRSLRLREQALLVVLYLAVWGCVFLGMYLWQERQSTPAPAPYATMEEAEAAGCVVIREPGFLELGADKWQAFYRRVSHGMADVVSIAAWDGGEAQRVKTLVYDGEDFHYTIPSTRKYGKAITMEYPYLLLVRHEPQDGESLYLWKESYVLTDKADLTGEELAAWDGSFRAETLIFMVEWK